MWRHPCHPKGELHVDPPGRARARGQTLVATGVTAAASSAQAATSVGDLAERTARTLADNVECPSLSPDGTRIAFKQAVDADPAKGWRPAVLEPSKGLEPEPTPE